MNRLSLSRLRTDISAMSSALFLSHSFDDGVARRRFYEISGSSVTSCHVEESSLDLPYSTRSLGNGDFGTLVTRYAEHATTYDERQPSSGADDVSRRRMTRTRGRRRHRRRDKTGQERNRHRHLRRRQDGDEKERSRRPTRE